jgi:hypothetical protein
MTIDVKDIITIVTALMGSSAIIELIKYRQAVRQQTNAKPNEDRKVAIEEEDKRSEADDRLIQRYETALARAEARIIVLEAALEKKYEREVALITVKAEQEQHILDLTREIANLNARLEKIANAG